MTRPPQTDTDQADDIAALRAQNRILIAQTEALRQALDQARDELVRLSLLVPEDQDPEGRAE